MFFVVVFLLLFLFVVCFGFFVVVVLGAGGGGGGISVQLEDGNKAFVSVCTLSRSRPDIFLSGNSSRVLHQDVLFIH